MQYLVLEKERSAARPIPLMSDEELLRTAVTEDPEYFSEIIKRYQAAFLRKATSILKREADAEDAVQEAFVKVYIHGGRFKPVAGASFQSWAYRILINTCLTAYRKVSRERTNVLYGFDEVMSTASHMDGMEARLSLDAFLSVLSKMPKKLASVLHQIVLFGRKPKDIAVLEKVSVGAVRTRLHRARRAFERVRAGDV